MGLLPVSKQILDNFYGLYVNEVRAVYMLYLKRGWEIYQAG